METQENRDEIPGTTPPSGSEDIFDESKFSDIQIDYLLRTRTYKQGDKQIYEIMEDRVDEIKTYKQVSKKEYDINRAKKQKEHEASTQQYNERIKIIQTFTQKGGEYACDEFPNTTYAERLMALMDEKQLDHIKQIPAHQEQEETQTSIQLFTTLAKKEKTPDYYQQIIINFLESNEPTIGEIWITDEEINKIQKIFTSGYIRDLSLYQRFENFKKQNKKQHYKRIYLFGTHYEIQNTKHNHDYYKNKWKRPERQKYLDYGDVEYIKYFLEKLEGKISDLDEETAFKTRIKLAYQKQVKSWIRDGIWTGKQISDQDILKYYPVFHTTSLHKLGISTEEIVQTQKDVERNFIEDFTKRTKKPNIDDIGMIVKNPRNLKKENGMKNFMTIIKQINPAQHNDTIYKRIQECIMDGITRIINKEKIMTADWKDKNSLSYKQYIAHLVDYIDASYAELAKLDQSMAAETKRESNRDAYINEYIAYYRDTFIQKKIAEILKGDINDGEAIEQQILTEVQAKLYTLCIGEFKKQKGIYSVVEMHITNNYLTNKKTIQYIKDAFFKTGHATLLKHLYPDDQQRKAIRQRYIQTIIENIFNQITINAQDISTFSIVEYQMIDPLTYRYKKYGGQKHYQRNGIESMVQQYYTQALQDEIHTTLQKIQKMIKNDTISISKAYENIIQCIGNIQRYQHKYIKSNNERKDTKQYIQENTEYNIQSGMKYTNTYIDYTSLGRLHIQDIEQKFPQEVQTMFSNRYNEIEKLKDKILQYILTRRVNTHGQAGGKLDRLSQEFLKQKFGVYTGSPEQIDALLDMLTENLYEIIITDLNIETREYILLGNDRERLKIYIPKYIQHMRQNIALQGESGTYELLS